MAPIKLYGPAESFRNFKARIAALYVGQELELTPDFEFGVSNKSPEFLSKFPLGKVPAIEHGDIKLSDSNAITRYIAGLDPSANLLSKNNVEESQMWQYIFCIEADIVPHVIDMFIITRFGDETLEVPFYKHREELKRLLKILDFMIGDKSYIVGNRITIADIIVGCDLLIPFKFHFDASERQEVPNLIRYFEHLRQLPQFQKVLADFEYAKEASTFQLQKND